MGGTRIALALAMAEEGRKRRIAELETALREILKGEGRFDRDQYRYACNTIEDMMEIARKALGESDAS